MGLHHPAYTSYIRASNTSRASLCSSTSQKLHEPLKGLALVKVRTQELKPKSITTSHFQSSQSAETGHSKELDFSKCLLVTPVYLLEQNECPESSAQTGPGGGNSTKSETMEEPDALV